MNDREYWRKYAVEADSVEDYLDRYYKPERYTGRGEEYAAALLKSYKEDVEQDGYCMTSHHDNVTGRIIAWFPEEEGEEEC